MTAQTRLFLCMKDNYGVLVHDPATGATAAIDAPEAAPVEAALAASGWTLTDILVTHHHGDHTGGIAELKQRHHCRVVAPRREAGKIPAVDVEVGEGDRVKVGSLTAEVIETPGHTLGQINYFFPNDKLLFAGDTLFSIGCGRVIEGTPELMWQSLLKLRALPDDTAMFCGHEYTEANIRFALTIEPDNKDLRARAEEAKRQVAASRGYDLPAFKTYYDFDTWKTEKPPLGTVYNYPPRGDEQVSMCGYPARPDVASQIYNQSIQTVMVGKVTQGKEKVDDVIKWAEKELEGYLRT